HGGALHETFGRILRQSLGLRVILRDLPSYFEPAPCRCVTTWATSWAWGAGIAVSTQFSRRSIQPFRALPALVALLRNRYTFSTIRSRMDPSVDYPATCAAA